MLLRVGQLKVYATSKFHSFVIFFLQSELTVPCRCSTPSLIFSKRGSSDIGFAQSIYPICLGAEVTEPACHCLIGCPDFTDSFLVRLLLFVNQASSPVAVADVGAAEVCAYSTWIL